ncbi:hypothetical protein ACKKBF_B14230 [Auxenochlorella protothecoides x Auxenochlorella symbiontica]
MASQDRGEHQNFSSSKGQSGGGQAGSRSKENLTFIRQVPKFLQAHAHLLGKGQGAQGEDDPTAVDNDLALKRQSDEPDAEDDAREKEEALAQALAADPNLLLQHPELADVAIKVKAGELKEKGNRAFNEGKFDEAARHFQECVVLCPRDEVFWSNLSAARASLKDWPAASAAAETAIGLKPRWAKAHARLAAAYTGQEDHVRALERYERALQLEPSNGQFQEALSRARVAAGKQEAEGKHRFKRKASAAAEERPVALAGSGKAPVKKRSTILSFSADEDDDGET